MKRVFCLFTFLALSTICFAAPDYSNEIEAAKEQLKHVNTYYWLSRARDNDRVDAKKMLLHAKMANNILKDLKETARIRQMKYQAESAISEADAQIAEASKTVANFSPLFSSLTGRESAIGRYENPDDIAIKRSVEGILKLIKVPTRVSQLYLIIVAEGNNRNPEEVAHGYINANTSYYAIPRYELSTFLVEAEMNALNHDPISKKILDKICQKYSIKSVGALRLFKNDSVGRISHWGANYKYWDAGTGKSGYYCYADGFCESSPPYADLLWLLILTGFPATLLFNLYNKKFNKNSRGSFAPLWLASLIGVLSVIVVWMAFKGISVMNIDQSTLIASPQGFWWIAAFTLVLSLMPLVLAYIGASRINPVSAIMNNPETISSILFGSYLGSFTFLSYIAADRMGVEPSLLIVVPGIIVSGLVALRVGITYASHAISNDEASGVEYIVLLIGLAIYMLFVLRWDFRLLLAASAGCLIFSVMAALIPIGIVKLKRKIAAKAEKADEGGEVTGIAWLRHTIKEPQFFCKPWEKEFEKVQKWITENDDPQIEVVFIEAPIGCGKTRTAKEIAKRIEKQYKEKQFRAKILFGDCDEFSQDADVIPYEPFAQALSDLLGVGRFANPAEKADRLKSGLVGMGLKTAMSATGMGALETLLDARDEEQAVKTNTKEMANVVAEALTDLSKLRDGKKGKVVFIIDDVQWMDNETFELLGLLFDALGNFKDNQVSFIFTCRSDSPQGHGKVKDLIKELEKSSVVNINDNICQQLLENEEVVEGILENLRFEFKTKQLFTRHFRDMGVQRPLHILQSIETTIDMKMLEAFADRYVLSKDANLKKLPPPDDFNRMVEEILSGLDPRIISILQCCAVTGRSFRFSIIADIFGIDRLELLRLFKEPEERNIIRDVTAEDDVYEFVEKRTVGIFRGLKWTPREDDSISQQVREYHKRFISLREKEIGIDKNKNATSSAFYRDIVSLASHSNAVRDVYPDKAVDYNRLAAERTYSRGMFSTAVNYYNNSIEIIEKDQTKVALEIMLGLYISYAKCLLDEQSDSRKVVELAGKAHEILRTSGFSEDFDKDWTEIEISLIEALNHYRSRQFEDASIKSDGILKNDKASVIQKARAKFYYAASIPPQDTERRRDMHLEVLEETEKLLETGLSENNRVELLKIKSEAANNTGFVYLHSLNNPDQAITYFEMAIKLNKMRGIGDQKGIAISHTGLGDVYNKLNQSRKAEQMYKVNLDISEKSGDLQGICMMNSKLGAIKIEKAKKSDGEMCANLCKEANKLYEKSLATAEDQGNPVNICFALSGMIETIIASESYGQANYVCTKFEEIGTKLDLSNASEFAKDALKKSLNSLAQSSPEHADLAKKNSDAL